MERYCLTNTQDAHAFVEDCNRVISKVPNSIMLPKSIATMLISNKQNHALWIIYDNNATLWADRYCAMLDRKTLNTFVYYRSLPYKKLKDQLK